MHPAICHGDVLTVRPVAPSHITPGSVAVYRRFDRLFVHRVLRIDADDSGAAVFALRGDAASGWDAPVTVSQILGTVVKVERRTSTIRRHARMCRQRLVHAGVAAGAICTRCVQKVVFARVTAAAFCALARTR